MLRGLRGLGEAQDRPQTSSQDEVLFYVGQLRYEVSRRRHLCGKQMPSRLRGRIWRLHGKDWYSGFARPDAPRPHAADDDNGNTKIIARVKSKAHTARGFSGQPFRYSIKTSTTGNSYSHQSDSDAGEEF